MNFLPGMKTYIGIGITLFGTIAQAVGWDWWAAMSGDIESIANQVLQVIGLVVATVGRAVAKPKA